MKKLLMAAIAVFMMASTAFATESVVMVNNNVVTVQSGNAIDKMIAFVNGLTRKVNGIKTADELLAFAEQVEEEMTAFEKKYLDEIEALENVLTKEQQDAYMVKLDQVLKAFETAVEKKTKELLGDYDLDYDDLDF
jgi:vancomycin resistance protein YoaR